MPEPDLGHVFASTRARVRWCCPYCTDKIPVAVDLKIGTASLRTASASCKIVVDCEAQVFDLSAAGDHLRTHSADDDFVDHVQRLVAFAEGES